MLRIEAGLIFAGYEFDDQVDPFEAGIGFTVTGGQGGRLRRQGGARRAARAPAARRSSGSSSRATRRPGTATASTSAAHQIGVVTSGTRSPVLKKNIALCRMDVQLRRARHRGRGRQARRPPEAHPGDGRPLPVLRPREAAAALVIDAFSPEQVDAFDRDGFVIVEEGLVSPRALDLPARALRAALRGRLRDRDQARRGQLGARAATPRTGRGRSATAGVRTPSIAAQVLSERTGRLAAQLARYRGVRLLQDNVLWKPPGAKAIGFHQDSSYADYLVPAEMLTCWISLARPARRRRARSSTCAARTSGRGHRRSARSSTRRRTGSRRRGARRPTARSSTSCRSSSSRAAARSTTASPGTARRRTRTRRSARMALVSHMLPVEVRFHETNVDLDLLALQAARRPVARRVVLPGAVGRVRLPDAVARLPARWTVLDPDDRRR